MDVSSALSFIMRCRHMPEPVASSKVLNEMTMKGRAKAGPAQKPNINRTPYGNHQSGPQADSGE